MGKAKGWYWWGVSYIFVLQLQGETLVKNRGNENKWAIQ